MAILEIIDTSTLWKMLFTYYTGHKHQMLHMSPLTQTDRSWLLTVFIIVYIGF